MTDERLAKHVYDILTYGLSLKDRLDKGDRPQFEVEIDRMKGMLWGDSELGRNPVYAGTVAAPNQQALRNSMRGYGPGSNEFLGVRYALCCWLDEIFIEDSPAWTQKWREMTMEVAFFGGTQERAWRFWEQAVAAEKRPDNDAVEAYLWCVMLGFRGSPSSVDPVTWTERVKKRILAPLEKEFPAPPDQAFPSDAYPRRGRSRFAGMVRIGGIVAAVAVIVVGYLLGQMLSNN
jgi:type IV/VI secretion system ImpK/VasF family protein